MVTISGSSSTTRMLAFDMASGYGGRRRTVKLRRAFTQSRHRGIRGAVSRRWLWLLIAAVIGIAALSMIGDVRDLGDRLAGFGWWALFAALGLALGNYVMRFVRWQLYLRRQDVHVPVASS